MFLKRYTHTSVTFVNLKIHMYTHTRTYIYIYIRLLCGFKLNGIQGAMGGKCHFAFCWWEGCVLQKKKSEDTSQGEMLTFFCLLGLSWYLFLLFLFTPLLRGGWFFFFVQSHSTDSQKYLRKGFQYSTLLSSHSPQLTPAHEISHGLHTHSLITEF